MPTTLGTNIASIQAQSKLAKSSEKLARTFERLSSGMRINHASDDAAGLAISTQLSAKARTYAQGIRNLNDGVSLISIAESSLSALSGIVNRMQELAEQSANGVYSTQQRRALDREAQALASEYGRILESTTFNGLNPLDGSLSQITLQGGDSTVTLQLNRSDSSTYEGTGTLSLSATLLAGDSPNGQTIGDVNGDGKADIITTDFNSATIEIFLGNGDGTFRSAQTLNTGIAKGTAVVLGDINGDGKVDLMKTSGYTGGFTQVFLGTGSGSFAAAVNYQGGTEGLVIGDFNNDNILDLASADPDGFELMIGNSNGSFRASTYFADGHADNRDIALGDFDRDGNLDIVTTDAASNKISVFFGLGTGSFSAAVSLTGSGNKMIYPSAADVNGDGMSDIIVADRLNGKVDVLLSNGNGTFKAAVSYGRGTANSYSNARLGDFNGDGELDILVSARGINVVDLMIGNGDGTFRTPTSFATGIDPDTMSLGDLNGDGVMDAVMADFSNPGHLAVMMTQSQLVPSSISERIALNSVNLLSISGARSALDSLAQLQSNLSQERGHFGAFESRVLVFMETLRVGRENFLAAAGRLSDADISQETAEVARMSIIQKSTAAVLAQANQQPALALELLRS